jgi:peptide/nickel transport system substrate-binding protein
MIRSLTARPPALRRTLALVAALASFSLVATDAAAQRAENMITVAQASDTLTLDPSVDTSPISLNLFQNIFDQLTEIGADGSINPKLATEWTSNADSTEWVFSIRTDAKWHDGTMVSIGDVLWTFQKIMADDSSPVKAYLSRVASVEQRGDDQIAFLLNAPFAPFARQMTLVSIMPQAAYEAVGAEAFNLAPVGSGPFKMESWVKDDRLVLKANSDYWGGAPAIETVVFRPVPSEAARASALLSGELDVVPLLPPALVDRIDSADGVNVQKVASNRVLYLGFDTTQTPYDNVKLRQAIDHAIDRTAITDRLLRGLGVPMGQIVAPVTFGYDPAIEPTPFDLDIARRLIEESGYDGAELTFLYPNNRYAFGEEVAQAIGGMLQEAGINVKLEGMEYSAYFPRWLGKELNTIHMFGFGPSIMDAQLPLGSLLASDSRGYWSDPAVDELIAAQLAESDPVKRQAIISEIWAIVKEQVPYSMLYNEIQAYGVADDLNWSPRPDERLLFKDATLNN